MKTRITAICLSMAVLIGILCGCSAKTEQPAPAETAAPQAAEPIQAKGKSYFSYFDTVSYVYSYAGDSAELFDERSAGASSVLEKYHQLFDIYHEYSGITNLCTINRCAGGEPLKVDAELVDFLLYAQELYELTDGEMNVMLGAVLSLWHQQREVASENPKAARVPTEEELSSAAAHCGFDFLEIDADNLTVRITDPAASLDVGALGKGYATEKAAEYLENAQAYGYVLNVGGNLRIIGTRPDGSSWVTGIRNPNKDDSNLALKIQIADTACVTSGIYERYYTVDGVRYHHIIDKDTLYPANYCSSLTVVTKNSALADALSTALFCMSPEEGEALAERLDGVEVLWIFSDGKQKCTSGFEQMIVH